MHTHIKRNSKSREYIFVISTYLDLFFSNKLTVVLFYHLLPIWFVTVNRFIGNNSLLCCFWIDLLKHMIAINSDALFYFFKNIERI